MPIQYSNISYGEEVFYTANEYDSLLVSSTTFESDFLESPLIDSWERIPINNIVLYTVKYKGSSRDICILWGPMKNSGIQNKDNKRLQVSNNTPGLKPETIYVAIGAYNTGDTRIYVCIVNGVREFILKAQKGESYSSLWFEYPSIWEVYERGTYSWEDKKGRDKHGFTLNHIFELHQLISKLRGASVMVTENTEQILEIDLIPFVDFSREIGKYSENDSLPRNLSYRALAYKRENFTCELCGTKQTFQNRDNEEYFEGHHLIMYNPTVQRRFKYCLDHPDNIICLCPNCHRKIHNSAKVETKDMVISLFARHENLLKVYEIEDLEGIINDYTSL